MDTELLKTFVTVADEQSLTRAASKLYISQPAVTKRLQALEQEIGHDLFYRTPQKKFQLTPEGHLFRKKAVELLIELSSIKKAIQNLSDTVSGRLDIATSHHIGLHHLPPLLTEYIHAFPNVDLRLHFLESEAAIDQLKAGKIDCALITLPTPIPPDCLAQTLWVDELIITWSPKHPLAKIKKPDEHNLVEYLALLPSENTYTRKIVENHFYNRGIKIKSIMENNYLETIRMMVDVGLGWSYLPKTLLKKDWQTLGKSSQVKRELGIISYQSAVESKALREFWKMAIESEQ